MHHFEGADHAQLRVVQPAGHPHRRLHARRERHDEGAQARAGALVERARAQLDERAARPHLHPAAADLRARLQQPGVQPARAAHGARAGDAGLRLSCHVTKENDNNAWLAQLLLQGTNFVNFVGRYAWVAEGERDSRAVAVTEWDEPQAVIGSSLQKIVYPDYYAAHQKRGDGAADRASPSRRGARASSCAASRSSPRTARKDSRSTTSPTSTTRTSPSASPPRRSRRSASGRS